MYTVLEERPTDTRFFIYAITLHRNLACFGILYLFPDQPTVELAYSLICFPDLASVDRTTLDGYRLRREVEARLPAVATRRSTTNISTTIFTYTAPFAFDCDVLTY